MNTTSGIKAFNGDYFLAEELERIVAEYDVHSIVETGSYEGDTLLWMAERWPAKTVWSIEFDAERWRIARDRVHGMSNAIVLCGQSQSLIWKLGSRLIPRTLFYLDAHWFAPHPLRAELVTVHSPEAILL